MCVCARHMQKTAYRVLAGCLWMSFAADISGNVVFKLAQLCKAQMLQLDLLDQQH